MNPKYIIYTLCSIAVVLTACYKDDYEVEFEQVEGDYEVENSIYLGEEYSDQIYYDLETKKSYSSKLNAWDIAFSTDTNQPSVRINTGIGWSAYTFKLGADLDSLPTDGAPVDFWRVDDPSGDVSAMACGDFTDLDLIRRTGVVLRKDLANGKFEYYYLQYGSVVPLRYHLLLQIDADITRGTELDVELRPGDAAYEYYTIHPDGAVDLVTTDIEPPLSFEWDFMFTRYARYFPEDRINYIVTGVLLDPRFSGAYLDSTLVFEDITIADLDGNRFTPAQDAIGFDWKYIDNNFEKYFIKKNYTYFIRTREGHTYKMRFLGFYDTDNRKGAPSFEFKLL